MAGAVEEALADGHHLVVEAGTGVGKSFAYLVPALLAAAQGDGPILVATRTIALQEQLVERDIPFLLDALQLDRVPVALAKGRGNYVCLRRLEAATVEGTGLFEDPAKLAQLDRIRIWAQESGDGTRADLPFRPDGEIWDAAKAEAGNCLHQQCPFYKPCAYQRSRRALYGAQLIVANHALLFADLALRDAGASVLPDYNAVILDEAHEVEDGAAENFGAYVSQLGIARQLGRFMGRKRGSGLFGRAEVGRGLYELLDEARAAGKELFESVSRLRGTVGERRLHQPGEFRNPLDAPLEALVRELRQRHDQIADPGLAMEWKTRTDRLEETRHAVDLIQGLLDSDLVYWVEGAGRRERSVLRAAPIDVAQVLRRTLFKRVRSVILTSATLRVGDSFKHLMDRIGLDEPKSLALGSPFDFKKQCRLLLHPNMPDPRDPAYGEAVSHRVKELVLNTGGGTFVLFTSYRALRETYDAIHADLQKAGLHVLRQGGDLRTKDIMQRFAEREDCVLFATDTFWQGVDVRGRNLRLVIITRLPFAVPDHPLQQAREERIVADGGDAFRQLSLPQAVLKLRQGFGRLIRTNEDEGAVAILDPRVRTKRYGAMFLKSLPECDVHFV